MTAVRLHGVLAKEFGTYFTVSISRAKEVLRAIDANRKNFIHRINDLAKQGMNYTLVVDGKRVEDLAEIEMQAEVKTIDLIPLVCGAGAGAIGVGILTLVGAGSVAGTVFAPTLLAVFVGTLALTAVSIGLQLALAPKPDAGPPISATTKALQDSFTFSNKANVASQGSPVPVGYGRLKVGSQVIQFCIKSFPQTESSFEAMLANPFNINSATAPAIIHNRK